MIDFDDIFSSTEKRPIQYREKSIVRVDYLPFVDGDNLLITFEKTNSNWKQGIGFYLFGKIILPNFDNLECEDRAFFWEDTFLKQIQLTLFGNKSKRKHSKRLPEKGLLGIKNVWDTGDGVVESWHGGAAMYPEDIPNGKRYFCNDGKLDDDFDDIIFTVERI